MNRNRVQVRGGESAGNCHAGMCSVVEQDIEQIRGPVRTGLIQNLIERFHPFGCFLRVQVGVAFFFRF